VSDEPDEVRPDEVPSDAARPTPSPHGGDLARAALARARVDARRLGRTGDPAAGSRRSIGTSPDPQPFGVAIRRLLEERGWQTRAAMAGVMARWDAVVGAEVAAHSRPERFADGELVVVADSTAWATQLRLLARPLVARINEELGPGTVRAVKVRGPHAPSWSTGPRRVPGRGPRDTYG
jgi:predicted nucleic acid-binding Zn ribbon protein